MYRFGIIVTQKKKGSLSLSMSAHLLFLQQQAQAAYLARSVVPLSPWIPPSRSFTPLTPLTSVPLTPLVPLVPLTPPAPLTPLVPPTPPTPLTPLTQLATPPTPLTQLATLPPARSVSTPSVDGWRIVRHASGCLVAHSTDLPLPFGVVMYVAPGATDVRWDLAPSAGFSDATHAVRSVVRTAHVVDMASLLGIVRASALATPGATAANKW